MRSVVLNKKAIFVDELSAIPSPGYEDLVIKVHAVALTPFDIGVTYDTSSVLRSTTSARGIGSCFSGEISAAGEGVSRFKVGDAVVGFVSDPFRDFSLCDYVRISEKLCAMRPDALSQVEAVSVITDGMIAERALRLAKACDEDAILITGGCTPMTRAIIQISKCSMFGVEWVASTVSCLDDREYAESIGADETFDTSCNDGLWSFPFSQGPNTKQYDIVIDVTGESKQAKRLLKPGTGRLVSLFNKATPREFLDFNRRVGGQAISRPVEAILRSRFGNLYTKCSGRMSFAEGRYISVLPTGDGDVMERLSVLMDAEVLTPCVAKVVSLPDLASVVTELRDNPFGLRGRIVIEL